MADAARSDPINVIRSQLGNLEETIGDLHALTLRMSRDRAWDQVRDAVNALEVVADVIRQALDAMDE